MMFRPLHPLTRTLAAAAIVGAFALVGPANAASNTGDAAPAMGGPAAATAQADGIEKRIAHLHSAMHITAAQEPQWTTVAQAMRDNAKAMDAMIKARTANAKTMTAIDDLVSYEKMAAAHEDGLSKFIPVFQALYEGMSDDQKKTTDTIFRSHGSPEKRVSRN
jgi:hypothetical protein